MKPIRRWQLGAVIGVLVILVAACGSSDSKSATTTTRPKSVGTLVGTQWALSSATNLGVPLGDVSVTAEFASTRMTGNGGCNTYGASYTVDRDKLRIGAATSTQMACPPPQMAVETAYLQRLPLVRTFAIKGSTLTLFDASGKGTLVYDAVDVAEAIVGTWNATSYYTGTAIQSVATGSTITAVFDASTVSGNGGCNQYNGSYVLPGASAIKIGPLASTQAACADAALSTQEQQYLAALALATTFQVTPTTLTLLRPGGTIAATFEKG